MKILLDILKSPLFLGIVEREAANFLGEVKNFPLNKDEITGIIQVFGSALEKHQETKAQLEPPFQE